MEIFHSLQGRVKLIIPLLEGMDHPEWYCDLIVGYKILYFGPKIGFLDTCHNNRILHSVLARGHGFNDNEEQLMLYHEKLCGKSRS